MDDERTEELRAVAHEVVATANVAGELDDQTFTMGIARKRIGGSSTRRDGVGCEADEDVARTAAQMGLREDGLDEKPWKKMVKELVETALVCPIPSSSATRIGPPSLTGVRGPRKTSLRAKSSHPPS